MIFFKSIKLAFSDKGFLNNNKSIDIQDQSTIPSCPLVRFALRFNTQTVILFSFIPYENTYKRTEHVDNASPRHIANNDL